MDDPGMDGMGARVVNPEDLSPEEREVFDLKMALQVRICDINCFVTKCFDLQSYLWSVV